VSLCSIVSWQSWRCSSRRAHPAPPPGQRPHPPRAPSDVDITPLNFPDQVAALTNHSIDAALMAEPFATRVIQTGGGALLVPGDKVSPGQQVVAVVFTERFIANQRDVGIQLLAAYLQGARKYTAA
jgi:ABC-type nitrate/sulfonate/bicarbonate transport system substrate-binding protein